MKFIKSKLLQKAEGRKTGKYLITLEVTDYDIEMLEDFATTLAPFDYEKFGIFSDKKITVGMEILDYKEKYSKWLIKLWRTFWKLWSVHDK